MGGFGAGLRNCDGLDAPSVLVGCFDFRRTRSWAERASLAGAIAAEYRRRDDCAAGVGWFVAVARKAQAGGWHPAT